MKVGTGTTVHDNNHITKDDDEDNNNNNMNDFDDDMINNIDSNDDDVGTPYDWDAHSGYTPILDMNLLSLQQQFDSITIVQDESCKKTNEPFVSYGTDLPKVEIIYAPLSSDDDTIMNSKALTELLGDRSFSYIWDNVSKGNTGTGKAIIDYCSQPTHREQLQCLCYVSSAGIYNPPKNHGRQPLSEMSTPIKESAGQNQYDQYAITNNLPYVSFRPQYIYGPKANKFDYM